MDFIIKSGADSYFREKLAQRAFTQNDFLFCRRMDEVSESFDPTKVLTTEKDTKPSIIKKLALFALKQKVKRVLYFSDNPPSPFIRIGLGALSFFFFAPCLIDIRGTCEKNSALRALGAGLSLLFSPLISLLFVPKMFVKEVVCNFMLAKEDKEKPFLSVGKQGRLSGVVYWYSFAKRARRHGLFGYAFNEYMGVPVSLFHFPFSLFLLSKLRFRTTYIIGFSMLSFGILSVYYKQTNLSPSGILLIAFLLLMSNVIWEHASLGVYEVLAWGFGTLGWAFFVHGMAAISGVFLGLSVLSHLGAATLVCLFLFIYAVFKTTLFSFLIMGIVAFLVAGYWFVPYFFQRKRLTRTQMINQGWGYKYKFGHLRLVQFLVYCMFAVSLCFISKDKVVVFLAIIPLLIAYGNAKIRWIYSPYTVRMFQAVVGMFCLSQAFNIYSLIFLLYFLYLPPKLLSWKNHDDKFYYDLSLSSIDNLIERARGLFDCLGEGDRVGFELGTKKSGRNVRHEQLSVFFGYFLADKKCEVFNIGMNELVKFDLYMRTGRHFNAGASFEELRDALDISGVTHLVAYSDHFKKILDDNGFNRKKGMVFKLVFKSATSDIEACLYEVPFRNERSFPRADIHFDRNKLILRFPVKGDYKLKYSYDPGLVCKQEGKELIMKDDGQGTILIKNAGTGAAYIDYCHRRLFFPQKDLDQA